MYGNGGYKKHGQLVSTTPYCKSVRFPKERASYFLGFPLVFFFVLFSLLLFPPSVPLLVFSYLSVILVVAIMLYRVPA